MNPGQTRSLLPPPMQMPSHPPRAGSLFSSVGLIVLAMLLMSIPVRSALFQPLVFHSPAHWFLLLAAAFSALVLHEAGHLLAAVCCRFQIETISLGPLRLVRVRSRWTMKLRTTSIFSGGVVAFPLGNELWRERMLAVVIAGPAASFTGVLLAASSLHWHPQSGDLVSAFLRAFIQIGFLIFVLGLIPNSSAAPGQNDAALSLLLWRDGKEAGEIFLYHLVLQHQQTGLPPCDFPLWLIRLMAAFQGRPDFMAFYAGILAIWAFDRGDYDSGNQWDQRALQLSLLSNPSTRSACLTHSACFDLAFRADPASAAKKLAGMKPGPAVSPFLQHCTLAAADLVRGCIAKSLAELATARSFLPTHLQDQGFEWALLKRLHAAALSVR